MGGPSRSSPPRLGRVCITAGELGGLGLLEEKRVGHVAGKLGGLALLVEKCVGHVAGQTLGFGRCVGHVAGQPPCWVCLLSQVHAQVV